MLVDLHTHTNASDGTLSPDELLSRSREARIDLLSITDHDTVEAYNRIDVAGGSLPHVVAGVEFSSEWRGIGVQVLGLNIDTSSDAIRCATVAQRSARISRAERIAERLERAGVKNALAGTLAVADGGAPGRRHFACYLVEAGIVKDPGQAFKKLLGAGKAGDVKHQWASLEQIIEWIRGGGGTAVLAHPGKYGLTRSKRLRLFDEFQRLGGQGIEVISGRQDPALTQALAAGAAAAGLLAACGSDFHQPGQPWARLGMPLRLPAECRPVWDAW